MRMTRTHRHLPLFVLCLGLVAEPWVHAQGLTEFERQAETAMRDGNYAEAYCILKPLALQGHADAQLSLGWMYANGYGLTIDAAKAFEWWLLAAEQGHPDAEFAVAMAYLNGEGVTQDPAQAMTWLHRAAQHEVDDAQHIIRNHAADGHAEAVALVERLLVSDWRVLGASRWVSVDKANVRQSPTTSAKVITTLERAHPLVELKRKGDWVKVGITGTGQIGWMYGKLLSQERDSS
jgi:TPR repeat protein